MKFQHAKLVRGIVIPTSLLCSVILAWAGWSSLTTIQHGQDLSSQKQWQEDYGKKIDILVRRNGINPQTLELESTSTATYAKNNE